MGFQAEYRLSCDTCGESSEWFEGGFFGRADVIRELRAIGWVRRTGGRLTNAGTECPRCSGWKPVLNKLQTEALAKKAGA